MVSKILSEILLKMNPLILNELLETFMKISADAEAEKAREEEIATPGPRPN